MAKPWTLNETIARHVREWRLQKRWSVRQFAEECQKAGLTTLTQASLTNLERGLTSGDQAKRPGRPVTVEELIGLAYVLGTTPDELLVPYEADEVQVVPGVTAHPWLFAMWMTSQDLASPELWGSPFHSLTGLSPQSPSWLYRNFDIAYRSLVHHHRRLERSDLSDAERSEEASRYEAGLVHMALILEAGAKVTQYKLPPIPRWMRDDLMRAQGDGSLNIASDQTGPGRAVSLPPLAVQEDDS